MTADLVIVGAGPYGLSISSHAKALGMDYELIGYPMEFWQKKMPPEMFIRTQIRYTGLSDPEGRFTLRRYGEEKGIELTFPMPRTTFVDYGFWFIRKTGIRVTEDFVTAITRDGEGFRVETEKGKTVYSHCVVIAVGLTNAKFIPENLAHLPQYLVSHSSEYTEFSDFEGKHVLVLGGGQSAWEAAALLNRSNARTELAYRRPHRLHSAKGMNAKQQDLADKFYFLSPEEKKEIRRELRLPTVSDFLVPLVEGKVLGRPGTFVKDACETEDGQLEVTFQQDDKVTVDHLIAATGFRYALDRLVFLKPVVSGISREPDGTPKVDEYFQSTVPGLYFAGPATAYSHGPTYHFIAGVWHTAKTLVPAIKKMLDKK